MKLGQLEFLNAAVALIADVYVALIIEGQCGDEGEPPIAAAAATPFAQMPAARVEHLERVSEPDLVHWEDERTSPP